MNTDLRRSKRYNDFIAISVSSRNRINGTPAVGPFAGRIINISKHGACLLMSLGVLDSYDVYRSTYKNKSMHLEIKGSIQQNAVMFKLTGRPVWMDPFILDDLRAFRMGVEFISQKDTEQSEDIINNITGQPGDFFLESDLEP